VNLDDLIASIEADASVGPLDRVTAAATIKDQIESIGDELLDHFVKAARDDGCSWNQIGEALGVTRQAAQQRHSGLLGRMIEGLTSGRFQRFTGRARTAVIEAQSAARERHHGHVGTEHVLIGLAGDDSSIACRALADLGVPAATIAGLVDERTERGDRPVRGHIPFTAESKQALETAVQEALRLGHNYIGTEHLLLALRRTEGGLAADILADRGVTYDDLMATIVRLLLATARSA
jgi:hypothetical protein